MITCDGWIHNVGVGDVVRFVDDNKYRVPKITPPSGPVVRKRTDHKTYRSFLRSPSQLFVTAPRMGFQFTQTESNQQTLMTH